MAGPSHELVQSTLGVFKPRHLCKTCCFMTLCILLVLTGFVCPHKITADEECQSSTPYCYECDSRYDPNCGDPFDFSTGLSQDMNPISNNIASQADNAQSHAHHHRPQQDDSKRAPNESTNNLTALHQPKKLPTALICHGCCVKITSKTPEGVVYVKRTCTTNLQINFFMVGLVCMKESGDRGKMCFCETDFCNGQMSSLSIQSIIVTLGLTILSIYNRLLDL